MHVLYGYNVQYVDKNNNSFICGPHEAGYIQFLRDCGWLLDNIVLNEFPLIVILLSNVILVSKILSSVKKARKVVAPRQDKHLSMRSESARHLLGSVLAVSIFVFITSQLVFLSLMVNLYVISEFGMNLRRIIIIQSMVSILDALFGLRFAVNFFLLILTGSKYRQEVKNILCGHCS